MGKIIRNGIEFSSTVDTANNISYDNSLSGLEATTTQKAIDEVVDNVSTLNDSLAWFYENGFLPNPNNTKILFHLGVINDLIGGFTPINTRPSEYGGTRTLPTVTMTPNLVATCNSNTTAQGTVYTNNAIDLTNASKLIITYKYSTPHSASGKILITKNPTEDLYTFDLQTVMSMNGDDFITSEINVSNLAGYYYLTFAGTRYDLEVSKIVMY